jgi:hypothetical protein
MTMPLLLRRLKLIHANEGRHQYEVKRGAARAISAALAELEKMSQQKFVHAEILQSVKADYEVRLKVIEVELSALHLSQREIREEEKEIALRRLLTLEKSQVIKDAREGILEQEAAEHLLKELNEKLIHLETKTEAPSTEQSPPAPEEISPPRVSKKKKKSR